MLLNSIQVVHAILNHVVDVVAVHADWQCVMQLSVWLATDVIGRLARWSSDVQ